MTASIELIRSVLNYDAINGCLTWRHRSPDIFRPSTGQTAAEKCRLWNGRWAGKLALNSPSDQGYRTGTIDGRHVYAHRVIWALSYGWWPEQVDHLNGNRSDNRLKNLSASSNAKNCRNRARGTANKSGVVGVFFCQRRKVWRAQIAFDGRQKFLGHFKDFRPAVEARRQAELTLGFSARHGL